MSAARITDPKTSHDAAKIRPRKRADVRAIILAELRKRKRGLADFQLEEIVTKRAGVTPQRVRTVRAELVHDREVGGVVVASDEYRFTPTGRKAVVWRAVA